VNEAEISGFMQVAARARCAAECGAPIQGRWPGPTTAECRGHCWPGRVRSPPPHQRATRPTSHNELVVPAPATPGGRPSLSVPVALPHVRGKVSVRPNLCARGLLHPAPVHTRADPCGAGDGIERDLRRTPVRNRIAAFMSPVARTRWAGQTLACRGRQRSGPARQRSRRPPPPPPWLRPPQNGQVPGTAGRVESAEYLAVASLPDAFDVLVHLRHVSPVRRLPA
jgi:hypothetical protein